MTDKLTIGNRRFFWPLDDMDLTFTEISATMRDIARNFRMLDTRCKFVFMPDPGLDLIRLNKIPHPVPWRELIVQEELEEHLTLLHLYTRVLNSYMGSLTPWTLDISHSHRNGNLRPVYDRMYDGLHFSGSQVTKLALEIDRYARDTLIGSREGSEVSIFLIITDKETPISLRYSLYNSIVSSDCLALAFFIITAAIYIWSTTISSDCSIYITPSLIMVLLPCREMISSDRPVVHKSRLSDWPSSHRSQITIIMMTSSGYQRNIVYTVFLLEKLLDFDIIHKYCLNVLNSIPVLLLEFKFLLFALCSNCSLYDFIIENTEIMDHTFLFIVMSYTIIQCQSCKSYISDIVIFKVRIKG